MIRWMQEKVEWEKFPNSNNITSFDSKNKVFLTLTDKSYTDGVYLYNTCSIDHRTENLSYITSWHKKLKIHEFISKFWKNSSFEFKEKFFEPKKHIDQYVLVRGRKIIIDGMMEGLDKKGEI